MIPLRDTNPSRTAPFVTIVLIAANILVFLYEISLGDFLNAFVIQFGVVPERWTSLGQEGVGIAHVTFPYFSSLFLHASWWHLIGNMWFLWIFGDNIEDRIGHLNFFIFYLLCGFIAGAAHTVFSLYSAIPTVGASGAIAGVLGAYLVLFPHAKILTLIPLFYFVRFVELPAITFLGLWFLIQFANGLIFLPSSQAGVSGVAWWAHIGGFLAGAIIIQYMTRSSSS